MHSQASVKESLLSEAVKSFLRGGPFIAKCDTQTGDWYLIYWSNRRSGNEAHRLYCDAVTATEIVAIRQKAVDNLAEVCEGDEACLALCDAMNATINFLSQPFTQRERLEEETRWLRARVEELEASAAANTVTVTPSSFISVLQGRIARLQRRVDELEAHLAVQAEVVSGAIGRPIAVNGYRHGVNGSSAGFSRSPFVGPRNRLQRGYGAAEVGAGIGNVNMIG